MDKLSAVFVSAVLLASACDVGQVGPSPGSGSNMDPPPPKGGWTPISPPLTGLSAIQVNAENEIYAVVGNQIYKGNGTSWAPVTAVAPSTVLPTFHVASASSIYVMIDNLIYRYKKIWKWDGTEWAALTSEAPIDIQPEFQFVSEKLTYAVIGQQIGKWDGTAWSTVTGVAPWTPDTAFHLESTESLIYSLFIMPSSKQIWKWDSRSSAGSWSTVTTATPSDTKAFQFDSETSIFEMIGNQIFKWNGTAWMPLTEPAPGDTQASFQVVNDHLVYAVIGTQVYKWTPMLRT
jgi:hypothetical protein